MNNISGSYFFKNGHFYPTFQFGAESIGTGEFIYEVLRINSGIAVFLEDHISRLKHSLALAGINYQVDTDEIKKIIQDLIKENNTVNGNVKIILHTSNHSSQNLYAFFIPHFYPDDTMYRDGVSARTYKAERKNPNIKKLHAVMIQRISSFISENKIYDAILVDDHDCITEGSKTNVFFVKKNIIYTASEEKVLKGITRQKIVQLCKELNLTLLEQNIAVQFISECDAAFFTGTSPKVLPIRHIDDTSFQVNNQVMRLLMKAYDHMMESYILLNRNH